MPKNKKEKTEKESKSEKAEAKKISQSEYEKKVVELAGKGMTAEKIGETLRKENIHPNDYNKKISAILKEKNLYVSPELKNIGKKLERIENHSAKNKQDKRAKREKSRVFSQLRKIKKYLKLPLK